MTSESQEEAKVEQPVEQPVVNRKYVFNPNPSDPGKIKPIDSRFLSPEVKSMVARSPLGIVSRNTRCPCGSNKRFKRCCMGKN